MVRRPRTSSFLPIIGLLAAVLVLLTIVTVTTYFNLDRGGIQARRVLDAQASAVVSGLAAGLRTGWRHWVWQSDSLQGLVQEMSTGDVVFIALLDSEGRVLADSNPQKTAARSDRFEPAVKKLNDESVTGWFSSSGLYLAGRKMRDDEYRSSGPGMGMRQGMMMHGGRASQIEMLKPAVIIVGLKTKSYAEARRRQMQHSLIMGGLLFVLGSGAIYFIFVIQNYRTIDRTLNNLSTYTSRIVDNMPNGLITLDSQGEPVVINEAARQLFGWGDVNAASLAGDQTIRSLHNEFGPRLVRGEIILEQEFDASHNIHGHLPLAVSASTVPSGMSGASDKGALFILRDLRQIRSLEEQVRQSEKLAAVGRLAAGIAHEVRNPLSSMRGLARFLSRNLNEKSREAEYLKVMVEEIDRLDRVITGLLDFARPRTPHFELLSLNDVARYTTGLITDDARHANISVREDMAPDNPVIMADRDQVIQAMLNVLLNAIEAMPDGGRMTVITQTEKSDAVFLVEDSGPGIPPEDRNKLVDPFFTTKKKGTGLGLAQVVSIMDAHKGKLELGGEPGMGARVSLIFPKTETREGETP